MGKLTFKPSFYLSTPIYIIPTDQRTQNVSIPRKKLGQNKSILQNVTMNHPNIFIKKIFTI